MAKKQVQPVEVIEERILLIRGHRVMLDADLAAVYGVTTKRLNEQVKRNLSRFPEDFMFRLTPEELHGVTAMRSQLATASKRNVRFPPYAFTEHGAVMLASVLESQTAIDMSIAVVRAFVRTRSIASTHRELLAKVIQHEGRLIKHDGELKEIFTAIRLLMEPPASKKRRIGF